MPILSVSKGLEVGTGKMMSEIIPDVLGRKHPCAFLSGPSFAKEVMSLRPTGIVAASKVCAGSSNMSCRMLLACSEADVEPPAYASHACLALVRERGQSLQHCLASPKLYTLWLPPLQPALPLALSMPPFSCLLQCTQLAREVAAAALLVTSADSGRHGCTVLINCDTCVKTQLAASRAAVASCTAGCPCSLWQAWRYSPKSARVSFGPLQYMQLSHLGSL